MPAVTRELSIEYNSLTIGGSSSTYLLDGPVKIERDYDSTSVTANVVCVSATAGGLQSAAASLEAAFRKPYQTFELKSGGSNLIKSTEEGYEVLTTINKSGSDADTGLTRRYEIQATWQMQADATGTDSHGVSFNNKRRSEVELTTNASGRRTVKITGTYTSKITGTTPNSARTQYSSSIAAYATAVLTAIDSGANWELIHETATEDTNDKNLVFVRAYLEIIYDQAGVTDHAALKQQRIHLTKTTISKGSYQGLATPLIDMSLNYNVAVDKDQSTNLKSLWDNTIKPAMIDYAKTAVGGSSVVVVSDNPIFDPDNNVIQGTLGLLARGDSDLLDIITTFEVSNRHGQIFLNIWDGNPYARVQLQGPADSMFVITERARNLNGPYKNIMLHPTPGMSVFGSLLPPGYVVIESSQAKNETDVGLKDGDTLNIHETTITEFAMYRATPESVTVMPGGEGAGVPSDEDSSTVARSRPPAKTLINPGNVTRGGVSGIDWGSSATGTGSPWYD